DRDLRRSHKSRAPLGAICGSDPGHDFTDSMRIAPAPVPEERFQGLAHFPVGVQSDGMPRSCAASWITSANALRSFVPTTVSSIGTLGGTVIVAPAPDRLAPAGVSRHCSPAITYQPSGPVCVCTRELSPGRITAYESTAV